MSEQLICNWHAILLKNSQHFDIELSHPLAEEVQPYEFQRSRVIL
jgi:hypothetical protein